MSHGGSGLDWNALKRPDWIRLGVLGGKHANRGKGEPAVTKRRRKQLARREIAKRSRRRSR